MISKSVMGLNFVDLIFIIYIVKEIRGVLDNPIDFVKLRTIFVFSGYFTFLAFSEPLVIINLDKIFANVRTSLTVSFIIFWLLFDFIVWNFVRKLVAFVNSMTNNITLNGVAIVFSIVSSLISIFLLVMVVENFNTFNFIKKTAPWQASYMVKKSKYIEKKLNLKGNINEILNKNEKTIRRLQKK